MFLFIKLIGHQASFPIFILKQMFVLNIENSWISRKTTTDLEADGRVDAWTGSPKIPIKSTPFQLVGEMTAAFMIPTWNFGRNCGFIRFLTIQSAVYPRFVELEKMIFEIEKPNFTWSISSKHPGFNSAWWPWACNEQRDSAIPWFLHSSVLEA